LYDTFALGFGCGRKEAGKRGTARQTWRGRFSVFFDNTQRTVPMCFMGLIENTLTGNLILTVMLAFAE